MIEMDDGEKDGQNVASRRSIRVLVGCPTWRGKEYALEMYLSSVSAMIMHAKHHGIEADLLLVDNSETNDYYERIKARGIACEYYSSTHGDGVNEEGAKARIARSRNILRERALDGNYDFFLSLEQDVFVEPETLVKLIAYNKQFVSTLVLGTIIVEGRAIPVPLVSVPFENRPGKLRYVGSKDMARGQIIEIKQSHLACTLISRELLALCAFRSDEGAFDDTCLCEDLLAKGQVLWCDTTLHPVHQPSGWADIKK